MSNVTSLTPPNQASFYLNDLAPPEPHRSRKGPILAAVAFALIVGLGIVLFAANRVEPARAISPTTGQALEKCRVAVAERLKSPGSARYGDVKYTPESPTAGRVTGWVDAENGFGALVRNRFACTAYMPSGSWWIQDVTFTDW